MLPARNLDAHIATTPGVAGGRPRIAGRRIRVQDVAVWHERLGMRPDEIASEFDLSLAEIHAALAYYFDHRDEIDRALREDEVYVEALRRSSPSKLLEKLAAR